MAIARACCSFDAASIRVVGNGLFQADLWSSTKRGARAARVNCAKKRGSNSKIGALNPSRFDVSESPRLDEIIVIGVTPMRDIDAMPSIPINEEVIETRIAYAPETLAFPAHTEAMAAFFDPSRSILYHA